MQASGYENEQDEIVQGYLVGIFTVIHSRYLMMRYSLAPTSTDTPTRCIASTNMLAEPDRHACVPHFFTRPILAWCYAGSIRFHEIGLAHQRHRLAKIGNETKVAMGSLSVGATVSGGFITQTSSSS